MKTSKPIPQIVWNTLCTSRSAFAQAGASATSAGFAGQAWTHWPRTGMLGSELERRIRGSPPSTKAARAAPITIQPARSGRTPGKASSIHVRPRAAAHAPSTPIR